MGPGTQNAAYARADAARLLRWAREARLAGTAHGDDIAKFYRRLAAKHRATLRAARQR